jgi:hypothetical protein
MCGSKRAHSAGISSKVESIVSAQACDQYWPAGFVAWTQRAVRRFPIVSYAFMIFGPTMFVLSISMNEWDSRIRDK